MRLFLCATILLLLGIDVFNIDLTFATGSGLSAKNAILYMLIVFLLLRMVVTRTGSFDARPVHLAWGVLMGYAILTWVIAGVLIGYDRYDLVESAIRLKSGLVDFYIFFLVFFLGTRSLDDTTTITRTLLFAAVFANFMTVLDTSGVLDLGYIEREDGRAQGALGESNQYAAFIILTLPAIIATAVATHGLRRLFWFGGIMISAIALMMTASRGALVGALIAGIVGAHLYRRYWSVGRLAVWIVASFVVLAILLTVSQSDQLLAERVLNQTGSIDLSDASSGRSEIWTDAIAHMLQSPITLFTGYGWDVYASFPFRFAPHNHYLGLWFNLGLIGLACGIFVLYYGIRRARQASELAQPPHRGLLIGFAIGAIALCTAIFFVDLHQPWAYFWLYAGVSLRMALLVEQERKVQAGVRELQRAAPEAKGPLSSGSRPGLAAAPAGRFGRRPAEAAPVSDAHGWTSTHRGRSAR